MTKSDLEAELQTIENDILPDLRRQLVELTSPDYDPSQSIDDEYRDRDIEYLQGEIVIQEKRARFLRSKQETGR
jgi:hypothetical protein